MTDLSAHLPQQRLQDALDTLDAAFAPLAKSSVPVGGCTHCYAGPVREVPDELMYSVAHKAPDHWDDFPALYRRLTPRIVRLLVTDGLDHGMVASRMLTAGRRDWPGAERGALEEVWQAWWRSVLHAHPGVGHVADVLETLAATTGTLGPWLAVWAGTRTEAADLHLGDALDRWLVEDGLADLRLGFCGEAHATPELLPWLLSLEEGRVGAARLREIERIAYG
ncbi:hypothetical protein IHE56_12500 [Streptomyces sp. ID01-12c]|uniref:hypothetical protein n=1 Tax=Streptomyces caniscabiei TaxID=2746961 RepID=UPI00177BE7EE|nr:hypothetical protein [Streptomyces caniscabiei]MBD9702900.1 hypothetical protein [Streptomyces caniscabiei]MDX3725841.1 hypothetical protein [Streptomyces caniscabiei]